MAASKPKLELTWTRLRLGTMARQVGKKNRPLLEPQILLEAPPLFGNSGAASPGRSYHTEHRVSGMDIFENHLIFYHNRTTVTLAPNVVQCVTRYGKET